MNISEFVAAASAVHGGFYDYSNAQLPSRADGKVTIRCPLHGPVDVGMRNHLKGSRCRKCAGKAKLTTEEFLAEARQVHGDRYDYSRAVYQGRTKPLEVICREHGSFFPTPGNHIHRRSGCPACGGRLPGSLDTFLARAKAVHGDKYDYTRVSYRSIQAKVEIGCPIHGAFWQTPLAHYNGHGCPACGVEKCTSASTMTVAQFIYRARRRHGDKYDYAKVEYKNSQTMVTITCPEHGDFRQRPHDHITRYGCAACSGRLKVSREAFIDRARAVHGDRYDYGEYHGFRRKAGIVCPEHGAFMQVAKDHCNGHGCPSCASSLTASRLENEVADWLQSLGLRVIRNDRNVLGGLEADIYLPDKGICIEVNGAYWHTTNFMVHPRLHEHKLARAEKAGLNMLFVWDFDWFKRQAMVKIHIQHYLGLADSVKRHARNGAIRIVANSAASAFYSQHHLQGAPNRAFPHYGLIQDGQLIACMSFDKAGARRTQTDATEWELVRFATDGRVRGAASRLFAAFRREFRPSVVWSFSDRQHFKGGLYQTLGFSEDAKLPADYRLIHQPPMGKQWHKSAWQRKNIPARLAELGIDEPFDPATDPRTERQMQDLAGVLRIMDAGKIRWKWTQESPP